MPASLINFYISVTEKISAIVEKEYPVKPSRIGDRSPIRKEEGVEGDDIQTCGHWNAVIDMEQSEVAANVKPDYLKPVYRLQTRNQHFNRYQFTGGWIGIRWCNFDKTLK